MKRIYKRVQGTGIHRNVPVAVCGDSVLLSTLSGSVTFMGAFVLSCINYF